MTDTPLKILHVFRAPLGGLFRHVVDLTRGQIAAGHRVGIVCDSTTGGQREAQLLEELAPQLALGIRRIPMSRNPGIEDAKALNAVIAIRDQLKPDVIHGHGSKGGVYARLPGFFTRSWPVACYTPHGGSFNYFPGTARYHAYMAAERFMKRRTDAFMMESHYIARKVQAAIGRLDQPVHVVHNGISRAEFEPVAQVANPADFLFIGELRVVKGIDTLLDAFAQLKAKGISPSLRIQGSGPDEAILKERVQQLDLTAQVTFVPPGPIRPALACSRIMVVPSRAESLPYVVLEAAAAGHPMISTNVGGIPEIFGPYADRLIPPDAPDVLAGNLKAALAKPADALKAESAALSSYVADNFSLDAMIHGITEAYCRALARRSGTPNRGAEAAAG